VLAVAVALGPVACAKDHASADANEHAAEAFGKLSIDELEARMANAKAGKEKLAIFDNNHRERFEKSHIATAKWVKFNDVKASDLPADKDTTLVFYCANEH
jgi:hypothetical protein